MNNTAMIEQLRRDVIVKAAALDWQLVHGRVEGQAPHVGWLSLVLRRVVRTGTMYEASDPEKLARRLCDWVSRNWYCSNGAAQRKYVTALLRLWEATGLLDVDACSGVVQVSDAYAGVAARYDAMAPFRRNSSATIYMNEWLQPHDRREVLLRCALHTNYNENNAKSVTKAATDTTCKKSDDNSGAAAKESNMSTKSNNVGGAVDNVLTTVRAAASEGAKIGAAQVANQQLISVVRAQLGDRYPNVDRLGAVGTVVEETAIPVMLLALAQAFPNLPHAGKVESVASAAITGAVAKGTSAGIEKLVAPLFAAIAASGAAGN